MNAKILIFYIICLIFLSSCGPNLLSSPGELSFHSGDLSSSISGSSMVSASNKLFNYDAMTSDTYCHEVYIYIKKIEVSQTGEDWVVVLDTTTEVLTESMDEDITARITSDMYINPGEYHGIRITIEPKIRLVVTTSTVSPGDHIVKDYTVEKMPKYMSAALTSARRTNTHVTYFTPSETITLTSANGFLIPFTVTGSDKIYFIFEFTARPSMTQDLRNLVDWSLTTVGRTTKFLY